MIDPQLITGLVLAGGRGSRMGGVDKGLQNHQGMPLALHALRRLQPQVGHLMLNANRNLGAYEAFGVPVWPDATADFPGPLAGMWAGLEHCKTPYLVTVPCDTPHFPVDLVERLGAALHAEGADLAMAATLEDGPGGGQTRGAEREKRIAAADLRPGTPTSDGRLVRTQPVFCLLHTRLMESLVAFMQTGQRKIDRWTAGHRVAVVTFNDPQAFFNANTVAELQQLQRGR